MNMALLPTLTDIARHFLPFASHGVPRITPYGNGRINDTYLVRSEETGEKYIFQKINPIFSPSVLEDIAFMTNAMQDAGLPTTTLIRTTDGRYGFMAGGDHFRMLAYVPGRTIEKNITKEEAHSAMRFVGKFHQLFSAHPYQFVHARKGFHDTSAIMEFLKETQDAERNSGKARALTDLANMILGAYRAMGNTWRALPRRIIHGDLKLANVRFAEHTPDVVALVDLDTLGRHSIVIDIADAARSWCNLADEGDEEKAIFDLSIFHAMMQGYNEEARFLSEEERTAIPGATAQITLELAARFATDSYREEYFKLDAEHYPDLHTQNLAKARAQFALYQNISSKLEEMARLANG